MDLKDYTDYLELAFIIVVTGGTTYFLLLFLWRMGIRMFGDPKDDI